MKAPLTCSHSLRGKLHDHDMWTQYDCMYMHYNALHNQFWCSTSDAIDCFLCKIPTVNLWPERELAVLPVQT